MNNLLFISNGDFSFPFSSLIYFYKSLYLWSFQSGSLNLDGTLRILSKILNIIVFGVTQNSLLTSYFYICAIITLSFVISLYFLKSFVGVKNSVSLVVISSFFVFNPIYLGNLSKIGLNIAVAMLMLILVFIKKYFSTKKTKYIFYTSICLNISLIHPFTFIVNLLFAIAYFVFNQTKNKIIFSKKLIFVVLLSILLNAVVIIPIFVLGTVDKSAIVSDLVVDSQKVDGILDFANTDGLVNDFLMTKPVLKDFEFYNDSYQNIYWFSMFCLYIVTFAIYLINKDKIEKKDYVKTLIFLSLLLLFQLLSTGTFLNVDKFLGLINKMPGGWAFRSPLKWQLYIPTFLIAFFAIQTKYLKNNRERNLIVCLLFIVLVTSNSYIIKEIYNKLIVPKNITTLTELDNLNLDEKRILVVDSICDQKISDELHQILLSKNVQTKNINQNDFDPFAASDFNYVLSCNKINVNNFSLIKNFNNKLYLFSNDTQINHIYSFAKLFKIDSINKADEGNFINKVLKEKVEFVSSEHREIPYTEIKSVFAEKDSDQTFTHGLMNNGLVEQNIVTSEIPSVLYSSFPNDLQINGGSFIENGKVKEFSKMNLQFNSNYDLVFSNNKYSFENHIFRSSFEGGPWQYQVGDCNNYDGNGLIGMFYNYQESTDGNRSIQLEATRHNACTSTRADVKGGLLYSFSFDYQSPNADHASYYLGFNDKDKTIISEDVPVNSKKWSTFSKKIKIPEGATSVIIYVYADATDEKTNIINRYDNFKLIEVPDLSNSYYLITDPKIEIKEPASISFNVVNPTKTLVHIKSATTPFYLAMNDSYNKQWQLQFNDNKINGYLGSWVPFVRPDKVSDEYHFALDDSLNGWYVDTAIYCDHNSTLCTKNIDGSYNIEMVVEFFPQRWFYLSLLISGVTLIGFMGYIGFIAARRIKIKKQ